MERNLTNRQIELGRLFNTAYFVAKEGLSFKKFLRLCKLQTKNSVQLGDNYLTDVACRRFLSTIGEGLKDDLRESFNLARFVAVLSDGSTDAGILEEEIVYVRFLENGIPVTRFAGIKSPDKGDAPGIFRAIEDVLGSLKIRDNDTNINDDAKNKYLNLIYKKLINANFDGASVMSGHISGVQTRLKEKQHGLVYTHCVAHRLELDVLDSIKFDLYLKEFDDGINKIFKFYYYSPTRRRELRDLAKLFKDEFKQLGRLKNIRWIASRERALKLLEINYKILVFDLESKSYGTDETSKKALGYLNFLKNPTFLFYLHFFEDLVEVLRPLSVAFQNDRLLACQVPRKIDECCAIIDALAVNSGDASIRLKEQINVDTNGNIVFKEVELDKPGGRRAPDAEHTPDAYEELYHPVFRRIIQGAQDYLKNRFRDFKLRAKCTCFSLDIFCQNCNASRRS